MICEILCLFFPWRSTLREAAGASKASWRFLIQRILTTHLEPLQFLLNRRAQTLSLPKGSLFGLASRR
ncbi:hypothetical protein [Kamptonema formosum]|uniref:hypothetical protein n=1 Tax=Kamptonema formosum TaxID=331992 RepID=UPI00034D6FE3|nr:hypothetical protein [Oscillatoria sp. PCC 10802]